MRIVIYLLVMFFREYCIVKMLIIIPINLLTGKAMIVAYSRSIVMKIYKRILELRPTWKEKVGVVMTDSNRDPEEWKEIIGNKRHKDAMAKKFKDNDSLLKIAIVLCHVC